MARVIHNRSVLPLLALGRRNMGAFTDNCAGKDVVAIGF